MEFKRGRKITTDFSRRMQWVSRCGKCRIVQVQGHFDSTKHFLAERKLEGTKQWWPIEWNNDRKGTHAMKKYRTRAAAEKVCAKHQQEK